MLLPRVIPILLLKEKAVVKGKCFKNHQYIGDPLNAVHIFNTKEVDELALIDIMATQEKRIIDLKLVEKISAESLMPIMVGGGISRIQDVEMLLSAGAEKVLVNSHWLKSPKLISEIANHFGSQSIVVSIDAKKNWLGKNYAYIKNGQVNTKRNPIELAKYAEDLGAGEIMINSIANDGMMTGYNLELIYSITSTVSVPVIAVGGAGKLEDFKVCISDAKASAAAAGSFFVYHGPRRAVLISYPNRDELDKQIGV